MKPNIQITGQNQERSDRQARFPLTDFNYHSIALDGFNGRCAKMRGPAFHTLSRDYFKGEACQYFLAETVIFSTIMLAVMIPMLNGARAVLAIIGTGAGV